MRVGPDLMRLGALEAGAVLIGGTGGVPPWRVYPTQVLDKRSLSRRPSPTRYASSFVFFSFLSLYLRRSFRCKRLCS
jgi:hypothetical protein